MRILMLPQLYPPVVGGQERHVHTLAHELARRGHEVEVTTIACRPRDVGTVEEGGVRVHRVASSASRRPFLTGARASPAQAGADSSTTRRPWSGIR